MAKFPDDPAKGVKFGRDLLKDSRQISFHSEYGNTPEMTDPSEFGWFWRQFLNLNAPMSNGQMDAVDWDGLQKALSSIKQAWGGIPIVYKCAGMGFHAKEVASNISDSVFLMIRRNEEDVITSTLSASIERLGDRNAHYGFRPPLPDVQNWSPQTKARVGHQVRATNELMNKAVEDIHYSRILHIGYEDLVKSPFSSLSEIQHHFSLKPSMIEEE